jgi:hypothetical protein
MGEPIKQLQATYDDNLVIPEVLRRTVLNYKKAHHGFKFDEREQAYIEYNTLREQNKDTEEITISKIQRLYDRDNQTEHIVVFQDSRCKDANNNYVRCPIVEKLGVVPEPVSNISNDSRNRITDVTVVEVKNDYYIPFSKEKMIELFESSKDRHKIVCYIGYTRPTRVNPTDTIEGKKIIWNQDKFVNAEFSELTDPDEDVIRVLDTRKQYLIPNKIRDINKKIKSPSQRVDSLSDLLNNGNKKKVRAEEVQDQIGESSGLTNNIVNETQKEFEELNNNTTN